MVNPNERLEEILESLRTGDARALDKLRVFARENPVSPDAWAHLAWNLHALGYGPEAHQAAVRLIELLPLNPDVHRLHARAAFSLGLVDESLKALDQAVAVADEKFSYRLEGIETRLQAGRPAAALKEYFYLWKEIAPQRPLPARLLTRILADWVATGISRALIGRRLRDAVLGWVYKQCVKRNQWQAALILARSVAGIDPQNPVWPERAAEAIYRRRDFLFPEYEAEIAWRNRAIQAGAPNAAESLARVHLHAGHAHAATEILERELILSPEGKEIYAHALAALNRTEEAITLYRELGRKNVIHAVNAGIAQLRARQYEAALELFAAACRMVPDHPLGRFFQAAAQHRLQGISLDAQTLDSLLQDSARRFAWRNCIGENRENWPTFTHALLKTGRYRLVSCPHCRSLRFRPNYLDPVCRWVRGYCEECRFFFANPQPLPETIFDLYNRETAQSGPLQLFFRRSLEELRMQPAEEVGKMLGRKERWWEPEFVLPRFEEEHGAGRRLLDVGCSVGTLLYPYHCRGWQVTGIDLDPKAVATARSVGLDARAVTLEAADFAPASFDLITMMDVIEHVPDPHSLLQKIYGLLKPGGILKLKTPCAESVIHYFYGPHWISNDTHLLYFSRRLLLESLQRAGFTIFATRSYLEANKLSHTYDRWRNLSVTPLLDSLVMEWDIGDTILVLARKNNSGSIE